MRIRPYPPLAGEVILVNVIAWDLLEIDAIAFEELSEWLEI